MTGHELRQIVNHLCGAEHRALTEHDMGPGKGDKRLHMWPPWPFVRKPLDQTASRRAKNSVPIAYDRAGIHYVFKTIEREQRVEGLVGEGERVRGTNGEVDKNS